MILHKVPVHWACVFFVLCVIFACLLELMVMWVRASDRRCRGRCALCGHDVSDSAARCAECGENIREASGMRSPGRFYSLTGIVTIVMVGTLLTAFVLPSRFRHGLPSDRIEGSGHFCGEQVGSYNLFRAPGTYRTAPPVEPPIEVEIQCGHGRITGVIHDVKDDPLESEILVHSDGGRPSRTTLYQFFASSGLSPDCFARWRTHDWSRVGDTGGDLGIGLWANLLAIDPARYQEDGRPSIYLADGARNTIGSESIRTIGIGVRLGIALLLAHAVRACGLMLLVLFMRIYSFAGQIP